MPNFSDTGNSNPTKDATKGGSGSTNLDNLTNTVDQLLSGTKSSQPNRADDPLVDCPKICPGNQAPTPGMPAMVVTISPNSPTAQSTTITDPAAVGPISSDPQKATLLLAPNPSRLEFNVQNLSADVVKLIFVQNKGSQDNYHLGLAACSTDGDGTGGNFNSTLWKGAVYALSVGGAAFCAVYEMTP